MWYNGGKGVATVRREDEEKSSGNKYSLPLREAVNLIGRFVDMIRAGEPRISKESGKLTSIMKVLKKRLKPLPI